jgi:ABC-2 type transport system ATP-binding protein
MYSIEAENVYKSFDGVGVLRGLTLRVPEGQVYGILGPNGAGKSTLIHLLLGFLRPSRGMLRVLGQRDLERTRGRVGYLPERLRYHLRYTAREYLSYLGRFSNLSEPRLSARVDEELRAMRLLDAADRQLSTYSKGMLQRLGVAQALLTEPEILLIDEPTSGLDPDGQREMLDLLMEMRGRGRTIFLATHILGEAEQLCDQIGILFDGKLAQEIEVAKLHAPGRDVVIGVDQLMPALASQLKQLSPAVRCQGREINLRPNTPELQADVLRLLLDARVPILSLNQRNNSLEQLYLSVVRGEQPPPLLADLPNSNSMFAPPGHPDAAPEPPPGRPSSGDTLLRELLGRESDRRHSAESDD